MILNIDIHKQLWIQMSCLNSGNVYWIGISISAMILLLQNHQTSRQMDLRNSIFKYTCALFRQIMQCFAGDGTFSFQKIFRYTCGLKSRLWPYRNIKMVPYQVESKLQTHIQVNLFQKLSFLNQLSHNMTSDIQK